MAQDTYNELFSHTTAITKVITSQMAWAGKQNAILTEKGLEILIFTYNLRSSNETLDYESSFIPTPKVSPARKFLNADLSKSMKSNLDFNTLVSDPTFWAHNSHIVNEMGCITQFAWSPKDFVHNNSYAIAILTNLGYTEVLLKSKLAYKPILILSDVVLQSSLLEHESEHFIDMDTLRNRCKTLQTSSICWGPILEVGSFSFVTAQRNGDIIFWELKYNNDEDCLAGIKFKYSSFFGEIISLQWIPRSNGEFLLVCGNVEGCIYVLKCHECEGNFSVLTFQTLWPHVDQIIPKDIVHSIVDNRLVILCSKHRYLLAYLANDTCDAFEEKTMNINDYSITSLVKALDSLYLTTVNAELFEVHISIHESFQVILRKLSVKENYPASYRCYSLSISPNKAIFALNLYSKKSLYNRDKVGLTIKFLYSEAFDCEKQLQSSADNKVSDLYDCIELLRVLHARNKVMSQIDYTIELDNFVELKAKINYILCLIQESCNPKYRNIDKKLQAYFIKLKDTILVKHSIKVMNSLFSFYHENEQTLTDIQKEIFYSCFRYIDYYCEKYQLDINDYTNTEIVNNVVGEEDLRNIVCSYCQESLNGVSCMKGHPVQFCAVSLTQITSDDYLLCRACGVTARKELYQDKPTCPLCDTYLDNYFFDS